MTRISTISADEMTDEHHDLLDAVELYRSEVITDTEVRSKAATVPPSGEFAGSLSYSLESENEWLAEALRGATLRVTTPDGETTFEVSGADVSIEEIRLTTTALEPPKATNRHVID